MDWQKNAGQREARGHYRESRQRDGSSGNHLLRRRGQSHAGKIAAKLTCQIMAHCASLLAIGSAFRPPMHAYKSHIECVAAPARSRRNTLSVSNLVLPVLAFADTKAVHRIRGGSLSITCFPYDFIHHHPPCHSATRKVVG